jgi:Xaa-Pro aminopeptidase
MNTKTILYLLIIATLCSERYICSNEILPIIKPAHTKALESETERAIRKIAQQAERNWLKQEEHKEKQWDILQDILEDIHMHHQIIQAHEQNAYITGDFLANINQNLLQKNQLKKSSSVVNASKNIKQAHEKTREAQKRIEYAYEELKKASNIHLKAAEKLAQEIDALVDTVAHMSEDAIQSVHDTLETHA